ncbi:MAG: hypothetical protein K0B16_16760, partial [Burkholderiaceae bacterium]|nr:hypothetical protein [Burkholderiaceae bacterium]
MSATRLRAAETGVTSSAAAATQVPLMTASERLAQSRERLRQAMGGTSSAPGTATRAGQAGAAMAWLNILKLNPAARIVIAAVSVWWAQHPLHVLGTATAATAKAAVQPLARRHPLGLVTGALLLGALLAWSRPWRWALKPAMFAGLFPQLISQAMAQA